MNKKILLISLILLVLVIPCVVSADTLIVYTAGSSDGNIYYYDTSELSSFATMRGYTGTALIITITDGSTSYVRTFASATSNKYLIQSRPYLEFNTSLLTSGVTVTGATLSLNVFAKKDTLGDSAYVGITQFTPSSPGTISAGDYDAFSDGRCVSDLKVSDITTDIYNNFTFTDTSCISKTSWTNLMVRTKWDIDNSAPVWANYGYGGITFYDVEQGASYKPILTITYSASAPAPVASFTANKNFIRIPNLISVTDTSTNTPTSWQWSWGDGTANSTTQNPTHQYKKRGKFPIVLTATNAGGSNTTSAYNVRVAGYENG